MLGLEHGIAVQDFQHLQHVVDAHIERIDRECCVELPLCLGFVSQPHQHHAQVAVGLRQLRHPRDGFLEIFRGVGIAAILIERGSQRGKELSAVRVGLREAIDDRSDARARKIGRQTVDPGVGRGQHGPRPRRFGMQPCGVGENCHGFGRLKIGQHDVPAHEVRLFDRWIQLQGSLDRRPGRADVQVLHRQPRDRGMNLGGIGIERKRRFQFARGFRLIVFLQIQQPGVVMRGPPGRIGLRARRDKAR